MVGIRPRLLIGCVTLNPGFLICEMAPCKEEMRLREMMLVKSSVINTQYVSLVIKPIEATSPSGLTELSICPLG